MKNLTQFIFEGAEGEVLLVISLINSDGVHNAYYFFTNLPEDDTKIINTKLQNYKKKNDFTNIGNRYGESW